MLLALFMLCTSFHIYNISIYTWEYCQRKAYKAKCHEVRYNYAKRIATQESPTKTTKTEEGKNKETKEILLPKDIVDWGG